MTISKKRANRNKTLTLTDQERRQYAQKIIYSPKDTLTKEDLHNQTICADLLNVIDFLPKSFADLLIIDPPYNLTKQFNTFTFKASQHAAYITYLETWIDKVIATLKPNGSLYICGDWRSTAALHEVISKRLHILNRITWQREKGKGANKNWKNSMEDIWFAVKDPKHYYFDVESVKQRKRVIAPYKSQGKPKDWEQTNEGKFRLTYPSNFWDDISVPFWSMSENTDHPTQKPEKLIAKLILASCPKDGVVFDPFLGSGTTSVTAKKLARTYVGIEQDEEYCLWSVKRLELANIENRIQGYENGIFWERNSR